MRNKNENDIAKDLDEQALLQTGTKTELPKKMREVFEVRQTEPYAHIKNVHTNFLSSIIHHSQKQKQPKCHEPIHRKTKCGNPYNGTLVDHKNKVLIHAIT